MVVGIRIYTVRKQNMNFVGQKCSKAPIEIRIRQKSK